MRGVGCIATLLVLVAASAAQGAEFSRELPVAPGGTLRVALERGSVDILCHESDAVRVEARASGVGGESVHFDLVPEGGGAVLTGASDEWLSWLRSGPNVRVRAWVPRDYAVDVRTAGGDVTVDGVAGGVTVRTTAGSVEVAEANGPVDVETGRGGIAVAVPARIGAELDALTRGGRVMVEHAVQAHAVLDPGRLQGTINGGGPKLRLRASGGSILVRSE